MAEKETDMSNIFLPRMAGFNKLNTAVMDKFKPQPETQLSPELAALLAKLAKQPDHSPRTHQSANT